MNNQKLLSLALNTSAKPKGPNFLKSSIILGWRAMLKIKHVPFQLFDVTAFPIMMTLLFTFLFGGAIAGSISNYLQMLIPGILIMSLAMISMYTGIGINTDVSKGLFDRFRSMPMWQPSPIVGALFADALRYSLAGTIIIILGLILGFSPGGGFLGLALGLLFALFFAFSLSWLWTTISLLVKTPESVMTLSGMVSFPLTFISNTFVSPSTLPDWLAGLVGANPISHAVTAVRGIMHGTASLSDIGISVISCLVLIGVFAPLSFVLYHRKNRN